MTVEEKAREPLSKTEQSLCRAVGLRVSTCTQCGMPTLAAKASTDRDKTCGRSRCGVKLYGKRYPMVTKE